MRRFARDLGSRGAERGGRDLERRAVSGVDHDPQAVEPVGKRPDEVLDVGAREAGLDDGGNGRGGRGLVDVPLDRELDVVRELPPLARRRS